MRPHDITIVPFTITKLTFRTFMNCRKIQKLLEFLEVHTNHLNQMMRDHSKKLNNFEAFYFK